MKSIQKKASKIFTGKKESDKSKNLPVSTSFSTESRVSLISNHSAGSRKSVVIYSESDPRYQSAEELDK